MYKIIFFVPEDHKENVKNALFSIGAGRLGNYQHCSWECEGQGQFMPLAGSQPVVGEHDTLEKVKEFRVEMLVSDELLPVCTEALMESHPYEVPAFEYIKVIIGNEMADAEHWL